MNVASLELCKELYELSGWDDCDFRWSEQYVSESKSLEIIPTNLVYAPMIAPAYDLGYLLRKLPKTEEVELSYSNANGRWFIGGRSEIGTNIFANTPEDATCKLAIELFKQGVLK